MALWTLKQHQAALSTLLIGNAGTQHAAHDEDSRDSKEADPNVFNFYVYLRTHPLLVRQHKARSGQKKVWLPNGKQVKLWLGGATANSSLNILDKNFKVVLNFILK